MIPDELYSEIKNGDCILFAGAGISTEGKTYYKKTFYEIIADKCKLKNSQLSFPELMQHYCNAFDQGRKNKLIREIIEWLSIFSGRGEIYNFSSFFHASVAKIPFFKKIVTTNWDTFFERELNILVPMVTDNDIPFWDDKKRQVLKIHGTITNPETIIATSHDYKELIKNHNRKPVFTKLKDLMATKTFLFIGYSMSDKNIQLIYDNLFSKLGKFARTSYALDHNKDGKIKDAWNKRGIVIINENAVSFMNELKDRLAKDGILPSDDLLEFYMKQAARISSIHLKTDQEKDFLSSMYQDGLIHGFQDINESFMYGLYTLSEFRELLNGYVKRRDSFKNKKDSTSIVEHAYWSGRVKMIENFLNLNKKEIDPYFK